MIGGGNRLKRKQNSEIPHITLFIPTPMQVFTGIAVNRRIESELAQTIKFGFKPFVQCEIAILCICLESDIRLHIGWEFVIWNDSPCFFKCLFPHIIIRIGNIRTAIHSSEHFFHFGNIVRHHSFPPSTFARCLFNSFSRISSYFGRLKPPM